MLDDINVLQQRDPSNALEVARQQYAQLAFPAEVRSPEHDGRQITSIVVTGMGGSALAALVAKAWLKNFIAVPFEVVRDYALPGYVNEHTLVIASSYSGNTEETLSSLRQAKERGAQLAIVASGGSLIELAQAEEITHIQLPGGYQPRMAVLLNLKALTTLLAQFDLIGRERVDELSAATDWLREESEAWTADRPVSHNIAKQYALLAVGKSPVFYGGPLTAGVAYKWKISWNENAKNVAFWNEYPEVNHNEFIGWTSHPVEKPFAVFDLVSNFEHPQVLRRFEVSDRLLSGRRPKAQVVELRGDTLIAQLVWASVLADFTSIYVAILNNVDPTPVALIEALKQELA